MLLTLSTTHQPATELGFLLMKHPDRVRELDLPFGRASVFFSKAEADETTAVLSVDIDPVGLVRGRGAGRTGPLSQYVNDRPYVANSMLTVAMKRLFNTAMAGRSKERQELVEQKIPLRVHLPVIRCDDDLTRLELLFKPLNYRVEAQRLPLNPNFPQWGESPYVDLRLETTATLRDVLNQLYILIPVLDGDKHYYISEDEIEKVVSKSGAWLAQHPEKTWILQRSLKRQRPYVQEALAQLLDRDPSAFEDNTAPTIRQEEALEAPLRLNEQRMQSVLQNLQRLDVKQVLDLGCGEGHLLGKLLKTPQFERIVGVDVSPRSLQRAKERLRLEQLPPMQRKRIDLRLGSLTYRDQRLEGFDAACVIEVIEHIDPPRLPAFERTVFGYAKPTHVLLTTPNAEYNVRFDGLASGEMRHADHRFEWDRSTFQSWAKDVAERNGYRVEFHGVGPVDETVGTPTQMAIFSREED